MLALLAGIAIVSVGGAAAALWMESAWVWHEQATLTALGVCMIWMPLLAAWLSGEAIQIFTPRRILDRRVRRPLTQVGFGAAAGLAWAALFLVSLAFLDGLAPETVLSAAASAAATAAALLIAPRVRPGRCARCDYDLSNSPGPGRPGCGRCPECGLEILPGALSAQATAMP